MSTNRENIKNFIGHWSLVIGHWSLVIGHWSLVISHWSLVIGHWSLGEIVQLPDFSRCQECHGGRHDTTMIGLSTYLGTGAIASKGAR